MQTHGISTLTFSVPLITGYVVQSYTLNSNSANIIEILDESGNRKAVKYDDLTSEISVDAYLAGATLPVPGAVFTYDGVKYETLSIEKKGENKNAIKVGIKGKKSEYITLV